MARTIGFIGLGNVGLPAATNLLRAGFKVWGFDIKPNAAFAQAGGKFVPDVAMLASMEVIVQSLPSTAALIQTVDALLPLARPGQVLIDISSYPLHVKLEQAQRLGAHGMVMLDCEVSGLPIQVENREAVLFTAGSRATVESVADVFRGITERHFYLGEFGAATNMKLIANAMVCVHNLMAAEALNLGVRIGLDPAQMVEVLGPSAAGSTTFVNKAPLMARRDFAQGRGPFRHMFGYLQRAKGLASTANVQTPLLDTAKRVYAVAEAQGRHDQDIAAVIEVLEQPMVEEVRA
jgi:3-hydroxyisobutyrate dehydrogenase-like beta-hydroxyacid dehydrogenase